MPQTVAVKTLRGMSKLPLCAAYGLLPLYTNKAVEHAVLAVLFVYLIQI